MKILVEVVFFLLLLFVDQSISRSNSSTNSALSGNDDSLFTHRHGRSLQAFINEIEATDWCKYKCKDKDTFAPNIGCIHNGKCRTPEKPCKFVELDMHAMLKAHNNLRNRFASGKDPTKTAPKIAVADMMALSWDHAYAFLAGCNLITCPASMKHDKCHMTPLKEYSGQNLGWKSASYALDCEQVSTEIVGLWYDEIKLLSEEKIKSMGESYEQQEGTGHFSAVVWASSMRLGCAATEKKTSSGYECMLACNYGPGGNLLKGQMFQAGEPTSKCPPGHPPNSKYKALCGKEEVPEAGASAALKLKMSLGLLIVVLILKSLFLNS